MAKDKEPTGRPKNLRRVHTQKLSPELDAQVDRALELAQQAIFVFIAGKVTSGTGEALKGALSHPVGFASVTAAVIVALHTLPVIGPFVVEAEKKAAEAAGKAVEDYVKTTWTAVAKGAEEQRDDQRDAQAEWVNQIWEGIKWVFRA